MLISSIIILSMSIQFVSSELKVIVGGGICGLTLAQKLLSSPSTLINNSVIVLEKSRGYGGRMATRRLNSDSTVLFDHGAQFYSLKDDTKPLHEQWSQSSLSKHWYSTERGERYTGTKGMSTLARHIGEQLDVKLEHKVTKLERNTNGNINKWTVHIENQPSIHCSTVVLTSPLPQSLDLLDNSDIPYDSSLRDILYAKAIVALCTINPTTLSSLVNKADDTTSILGQLNKSYGSYTITDTTSGIHNIVDQQHKGISTNPAYSIVMNPTFSETYYTTPDDVVKERLIESLNALEPVQTTVSGIGHVHTQFSSLLTIHEVKRWKYSHPIKCYTKPYVEVEEGLYLAGDGMGGGSVSGAVTSSAELYKRLVEGKATD